MWLILSAGCFGLDAQPICPLEHASNVIPLRKLSMLLFASYNLETCLFVTSLGHWRDVGDNSSPSIGMRPQCLDAMIFTH